MPRVRNACFPTQLDCSFCSTIGTRCVHILDTTVRCNCASIIQDLLSPHNLSYIRRIELACVIISWNETISSHLQMALYHPTTSSGVFPTVTGRPESWRKERNRSMDGTDLSPLHNHSEWSAGMTWMTLSSAVFSSAVAICSANSPDTRSSSTVGNR